MNGTAPARASRRAAATGLVQGLYYVAIGLWPLLGTASFLELTGAKPDAWSFQAVAVLMVAVGLAIALAGVRRHTDGEVRLLALAAAAGLLVLDVVHVVGGRVSPVYLVDALAQGLFALAWLWPRGRPREAGTSPRRPAELTAPANLSNWSELPKGA
jgi:hypothetical protein